MALLVINGSMFITIIAKPNNSLGNKPLNIWFLQNLADFHVYLFPQAYRRRIPDRLSTGYMLCVHHVHRVQHETGYSLIVIKFIYYFRVRGDDRSVTFRTICFPLKKKKFPKQNIKKYLFCALLKYFAWTILDLTSVHCVHKSFQ